MLKVRLLHGVILLLSWSTCSTFSTFLRATRSNLSIKYVSRNSDSIHRRRLELLNCQSPSLRDADLKPTNLVELPAGTLLRVYAISDLHVDRSANLELVRAGWPRDIPPHVQSSTFTSVDQSSSSGQDRSQGSSTSKNTNPPKNTINYDVIVVAGDVGANLEALEAAFKALTSQYDEVVCVPGNHELWVKAASGSDDRCDTRAQSSSITINSSSASANASSESNDSGGGSSSNDSVAKLAAVMHLAQRYDVHTEPVHFRVATSPVTSPVTSLVFSECSSGNTKEVGGARSQSIEGSSSRDSISMSGLSHSSDSGARLCIFPLHSWYAAGWDKEPELEGNAFPTRFFASAWADFRFCRWPASLVNGYLSLLCVNSLLLGRTLSRCIEFSYCQLS